MGPPPFGSGNGAFGDFSGEQVYALQWGHRLSAVETKPVRDYIAHMKALQWGHRLSAVETHIPNNYVDIAIRLQWVHRLSAVETGLCAMKGVGR